MSESTLRQIVAASPLALDLRRRPVVERFGCTCLVCVPRPGSKFATVERAR